MAVSFLLRQHHSGNMPKIRYFTYDTLSCICILQYHLCFLLLVKTTWYFSLIWMLKVEKPKFRHLGIFLSEAPMYITLPEVKWNSWTKNGQKRDFFMATMNYFSEVLKIHCLCSWKQTCITMGFQHKCINTILMFKYSELLFVCLFVLI